MRITVTVDGTPYTDEVEPRTLLVHYLRDSSARSARSSDATPATAVPAPSISTGSSVKSCSVLAVQADGAEVTTVEGLAPRRRTASGAEGVPREPRVCSAASARPA